MSRSGSTCLQLTSLPVVCLLLLMMTMIGLSAGASRLYPITSTLDIVTGLRQQQQQPSGGSNNNGDKASDSSVSSSSANGEQEDENNGTISCDTAKMKCAYRTGCGSALQHYLTRCAGVLYGDIDECPEDCQHALIGLASTDEGKDLMKCDCKGPEDGMCQRSKQRVEICRASVTTTMKRPRVSCRVATWICNADALCSTALQYYNENCKRMFHGKKCTKRCRNSINILRRQEKAARLNTCFCDGAEEYDCNAIHRNMDLLCYGKEPKHHNYQEPHYGSGGSNSSSSYDSNGDPTTNKVPNTATTTSTQSASWRILLLGLVLMLRSTAG